MTAISSLPLPNHQPVQLQYWGSESNNQNALYGYVSQAKPRWEQTAYTYQDAAALERFGIDATRPAGQGVVMGGDGYGYPVDGYTTGYTVKLPPPANFDLAQKIPLSFNMPSVVEASDGTDTIPNIPGDNPVDYVNWWQYGDRTQNARRQLVLKTQELERLRREAQVGSVGGLNPKDLPTVTRPPPRPPTSSQ